jgi:integrase
VKRIRVAPGVWRDQWGLQAMVKGGRGPGNTARFKPPRTLADAIRWQRRRLAELATVATPKPPSQRGTLKADVPRYLALLPLGPSRDGMDVLLGAWLRTPLALMRRSEITREMVQLQIAQWRSAGGRSGKGFAASTVNHRVAALRALYRALDPVGAHDPTTGLTKLREPEPEPRGVPFEVAEAILAQIKDRGGKRVPVLVSKARLRLAVILYTGLPHAQVMKIKREHIDFDKATLLTTPRRKGAGARARRLPLLPQAVEALRAFDAADCYGAFATTPVRRAWELARNRVAADITDPAIRALLATLRPYDLRHSFGTEVYRHSRDHRATAELLLHAPGSKITERYTLAAVSETAERAIAAVQAARPAVSPAVSHE